MYVKTIVDGLYQWVRATWVDSIFRNVFCEQHHAKCYATVFVCNTIYLKKQFHNRF